ncbi:alpha-ketoglutarate decarboxylase [Winogradskyella vidalii]|uniref:alpha-ketoglutarate decarboxylase n=1 Tax=Winogradskyella vidalii TaxID=2615024 RepID=UPI0015CBA5B6|nr:alpha-ketoglutarate decarboxylase [Winogradskyella vidalii]
MNKICTLTIKSILTALVICLSTINVFSQSNNSNSSNFWSQVEFGGGLGLNFGDGFFSGSISPSAVYRFNPYVASGVGLNYSYSSQKDIFKSTVLGGSLIGLFNPYREVQISTEFEQLHVSRNFDNAYVTNRDENYWYPALFIGAGYTSNNVTIGIRYDVLYDNDRSIYSEAWMPFVRFWF